MTGTGKKLNTEKDQRERNRGMELFPPMDMTRLPEALRSVRLREEVEEDIRKSQEAWGIFQSLEPAHREMFMEFCMGNRGLNILYDPFFKKLMTDKRLERLLSLIMGQEVSIVSIEHTEAKKRSEEASVMIMDLVVKLADGSYVDLEIQRITFDFPFERAVCYSSDIMVNQYDQLKLKQKQEHADWKNWDKRRKALKAKGIEAEEADPEPSVRFDYRSLRPVYVIVLMNSSAAKYSAFQESYIHRSLDEVEFDTGLKETALQKYIFISLDIFRKLKDNEKKTAETTNNTAERMSELEAWLVFLASDKPEDICRLVKEYPEFEELYKEIIEFRRHPEEMMRMVPEAIRMMDEGSFLTMLETRDEKVRRLTAENTELKGENTKLQDTISEKDKLIAQLQAQLAAQSGD